MFFIPYEWERGNFGGLVMGGREEATIECIKYSFVVDEEGGIWGDVLKRREGGVITQGDCYFT